jgi:hypothetical protein
MGMRAASVVRRGFGLFDEETGSIDWLKLCDT